MRTADDIPPDQVVVLVHGGLGAIPPDTLTAVRRALDEAGLPHETPAPDKLGAQLQAAEAAGRRIVVIVEASQATVKRLVWDSVDALGPEGEARRAHSQQTVPLARIVETVRHFPE